MGFEVIVTPKFEEDLLYYRNKRKFCSIEKDIGAVVEEIENGKLIGDAISDLHLPDGESTYKVRAANTDTHQGKSNGYRIIYYAVKNDQTAYLLTIYYKKDDKSIPSKTEIIKIIEKYC